MRPCRVGSGVQEKAPPDAEGCGGASELLFEVPAKETRTTLELRVDQEGAQTPPAFQPVPDISFDKKIMQAVIVQPPRSVAPAALKGGSNSGGFSRDKVQNMAIKYTCFKDGVSIVMVTLHVLAHKPIDLAWKKQCVEPRAKQGKALTAPQALVMAV